MSGLTFDQLELKEEDVKNLLDEPAQKFLKNVTIQALLKRNYNTVFSQIDITANPPATGNQLLVKDCINAVTAWHAFGTYGNSISQTLQLQDIEAYKANLEHYREIALSCSAAIGVRILFEEEDAKPPLSDPVPFVKYGGSLIDVDETLV